VLFVHGSGFGEAEGTQHFRVVFLPPMEILSEAFDDWNISWLKRPVDEHRGAHHIAAASITAAQKRRIPGSLVVCSQPRRRQPFPARRPEQCPAEAALQTDLFVRRKEQRQNREAISAPTGKPVSTPPTVSTTLPPSESRSR